MKKNDIKSRYTKKLSEQQKEKEKKMKEDDKNHKNEEEEIYDLIKSSALLKGLDVSKSDWKIRPIAK